MHTMSEFRMLLYAVGELAKVSVIIFVFVRDNPDTVLRAV